MGTAEWVTAGGTVALVIATAVLAYLTWVLARATHRPSVILTFEPNHWALTWLDMHVVNEGNATAFDIKIAMDPELPGRDNDKSPAIIPESISALRAGQVLKRYACESVLVLDTIFTVTISWRASPKGRISSITYDVDMSYLKGHGSLGGEPMVQIANEIKKLREHVGNIARSKK